MILERVFARFSAETAETGGGSGGRSSSIGRVCSVGVVDRKVLLSSVGC
jgi:hypothetical protein